jgi:hypothetical protein
MRTTAIIFCALMGFMLSIFIPLSFTHNWETFKMSCYTSATAISLFTLLFFGLLRAIK